jgi:hypothetical protein
MTRLLLPLVLLAGRPAPRTQCDRNTPSLVELRDGQGALLLSAKPGPNGSTDVCDGNFQRTASVKTQGDAMQLLDRGGAPRLTLRRTPTGDVEATNSTGQLRVRTHRDGPQLFVIDPIGIRLGTLLDGRFLDKTQVPAGTVEPRGGDQAIRDPDGATLLLVQPAASSQLAGLFTVAGLDHSEQLALYLFLNR